jgi:hypothetical protein
MRKLLHLRISGIDGKGNPKSLEHYLEENQVDGREFEIIDPPTGWRPLVLAARWVETDIITFCEEWSALSPSPAITAERD